MDMATQIQVLEKLPVSHKTNTVGKGMNQTILPPGKGKIVRQTELFNLGIATRLGEGKFLIQTC